MTMFKKLSILLCVSLFLISQSVLASEHEGEAAEKAAESSKEMTSEATAAGNMADEKKEEMKDGEMEEEKMKAGEEKMDSPAK